MRRIQNVRIQLRRDSEQNWLNNNPVLLCGEVAVSFAENQTRLKIGDGVSMYSDLPFVTDANNDPISARQINGCSMFVRHQNKSIRVGSFDIGGRAWYDEEGEIEDDALVLDVDFNELIRIVTR